MPSFAGAISESDRAVRAWMRIQRDPQSIVVERNAVLQTAQTVRVEFSPPNVVMSTQGNMASPSQRDIVVFGVRNHPDETVLDTSLKRGDRFILNNTSYEIVDVNDVVPGEVQADAIRTS